MYPTIFENRKTFFLPTIKIIKSEASAPIARKQEKKESKAEKERKKSYNVVYLNVCFDNDFLSKSDKLFPNTAKFPFILFSA